MGIYVRSLPKTLADGDYYLLADVIVPKGAVNVTATSGTVQVTPPFVSLGATIGAVTPMNIAVGKFGSVVVTVTNNGNVDAIGAINLTLGVSADGVSPRTGITLKQLKQRTRYQCREEPQIQAAVQANIDVGRGPLLSCGLIAGSGTVAIGVQQFSAG